MPCREGDREAKPRPPWWSVSACGWNCLRTKPLKAPIVRTMRVFGWLAQIGSDYSRAAGHGQLPRAGAERGGWLGRVSAAFRGRGCTLNPSRAPSARTTHKVGSKFGWRVRGTRDAGALCAHSWGASCTTASRVVWAECCQLRAVARAWHVRVCSWPQCGGRSGLLRCPRPSGLW